MRRSGHSSSALAIPLLTRSFASWQALSGRPTIAKAGTPRWRCASTSTGRASRPTRAWVTARASTSRTYAGNRHGGARNVPNRCASVHEVSQAVSATLESPGFARLKALPASSPASSLLRRNARGGAPNAPTPCASSYRTYSDVEGHPFDPSVRRTATASKAISSSSRSDAERQPGFRRSTDAARLLRSDGLPRVAEAGAAPGLDLHEDELPSRDGRLCRARSRPLARSRRGQASHAAGSGGGRAARPQARAGLGRGRFVGRIAERLERAPMDLARSSRAHDGRVTRA